MENALRCRTLPTEADIQPSMLQRDMDELCWLSQKRLASSRSGKPEKHRTRDAVVTWYQTKWNTASASVQCTRTVTRRCLRMELDLLGSDRFVPCV